jgi:hypothetical protein
LGGSGGAHFGSQSNPGPAGAGAGLAQVLSLPSQGLCTI